MHANAMDTAYLFWILWCTMVLESECQQCLVLKDDWIKLQSHTQPDSNCILHRLIRPKTVSLLFFHFTFYFEISSIVSSIFFFMEINHMLMTRNIIATAIFSRPSLESFQFLVGWLIMMHDEINTTTTKLSCQKSV